ncbi:MAG: CoA pyrophosphatase [Xanthomonadales bacterium]|nr:CoA pyrophosphatase [Xanthomonadales bacterium]
MIERLPALSHALHPLAAMPCAAPWNFEELADLLGDAPAVEAAVLVGLVPRDNGLRVLLTRRTDSLRHHAGQVSFPGGRIEADDRDVIAAALREAHEEIGLEHGLATPLGFLDPLITITGFRVLPVVARIDPDFVATPDPGEVAEVFEVDLDFLMHPDNLEEVAIDYRGRARHVLQFRQPPQAPHQRIWGVTASILFNLRERLAQAGRP